MNGVSLDKLFFALALLMTIINVIGALQSLMTPKFSSGIHIMPSVFALVGGFVSSSAHRTLTIVIIALDVVTFYAGVSQLKNRPRG